MMKLGKVLIDFSHYKRLKEYEIYSIYSKMPPRNTVTPRATPVAKDTNIAFTKAIQSIVKNQESFDKAVTNLNTLISDTFSELELKVNAKKKELNALEEKYTHDEKNMKLSVDLNVKEYSYNAATKIIEERDEVAVSKEVYENLKKSYEDLKKTKDDEIKEAVCSENKRNKEHVEVLKQTLELQKQAEVAKVSAQLQSQVKHIEILEQTVDRVAKDLDEQRKLTKDVAMASAKSGQMYLPQNNNGR